MALADGLVGHWSPWLGSGGYRLLDRSGRGYHGTLTNMDSQSNWRGASVLGLSGFALNLDGVNDYVDLATSGKQYPNLTSATWNFWIKFRSLSNNPYTQFAETVNAYFPPNDNYQLAPLVKSDGKLAFYAYGASSANQSSYDGTGSFTLTTNTWYMLTYVFLGSSRQEGYVNGVIDGNAANPVATLTASTQNVRISSSVFATRFFDGQLAQASLWSRALAAPEVLALYRIGPGWYQPYRKKSLGFVASASVTNRRRRIICGSQC